MYNFISLESGYLQDSFNLFITKPQNKSILEIIEYIEGSGIKVINIGKELSSKLKTIKNKRHIIIESNNLLNDIIQNNAGEIPNSKIKFIAIYNFGILLEPSIGLNASKVLKELSKNYAIILVWEHFIQDGNILHWGNQKEKYKFDFSDISIKILDI
ncbi:MAG: hypothetical protein V1773_18180 [bacterium]